ncbi:MAG: hypothetical protein P8045_10890 [Candidatus Thiodiazotropha sp.]
MDSTTIELPGSEIESITLQDGKLIIRFSRAYLVKTLSGSVERTRWWQAGSLIFDEAEGVGRTAASSFRVSQSCCRHKPVVCVWICRTVPTTSSIYDRPDAVLPTSQPTYSALM